MDISKNQYRSTGGMKELEMEEMVLKYLIEIVCKTIEEKSHSNASA